MVIERTTSHDKDKFIPVLYTDSSRYANKLFKHWAVQEFIALQSGLKAIWMQVLSLKKSFLWIFFNFCGLDKIVVRVSVVDYIYIYILLHVCWGVQRVQRMNDAEGFSLSVCVKERWVDRERQKDMHAHTCISVSLSIYLSVCTCVFMYICLSPSVCLCLSLSVFPLPPPPPPPPPPSPLPSWPFLCFWVPFWDLLLPPSVA